MTKKGFTLIELMGVIIILGALGLVVFPAVLNQMKKVDTNMSEATKKIIYSAADDYIADHKNDFQNQLENDTDISLEISLLVNEGYLSKDINFESYKYIEVSVRDGVTYSYKLLKDKS